MLAGNLTLLPVEPAGGAKARGNAGSRESYAFTGRAGRGAKKTGASDVPKLFGLLDGQGQGNHQASQHQRPRGPASTRQPFDRVAWL